MTSPTPEEELAGMTSHLDDYLFHDDLYQDVEIPGSREHARVRMTLGRLMRRTAMIRDRNPKSEVVRDADQIAAEARQRHRERWDAKLRREAEALMKSWAWYLENLNEDPDEQREYFEKEVGVRLQLARFLDLSGDFAGRDAVENKLAALDAILQKKWKSQSEPIVHDDLDLDPEEHWWAFGRPE